MSTWFLHEDGVDLKGIVLQSSVLHFSQRYKPTGLLPTFAADALFYDKVTVSPLPIDVDSFMEQVEDFVRGKCAAAKATYPKADPATVRLLSQMIGIPTEVLEDWNLEPTIEGNRIFLTSLL